MNLSLVGWCYGAIGIIVACIGGMCIFWPEGANSIPKNNSREKAGKLLVAIGVLIIMGGIIRVI